MKLTEKETLLKMIDSYKKHNVFYSYYAANLHCTICFYNNKRKDECNYVLTYSRNQMPEELYIKKFGYISLVEELL